MTRQPVQLSEDHHTATMELRACQQRAIHQRARQFAEKWGSKKNLSESQDSESFMDEFFDIFGIDYYGNNIISEYELPSKRRIDVFWPGVILIENKSSCRSSLHGALMQAIGYYKELKDYYKPKYILLNNFHRFEIHCCRNNHFLRKKSFSLSELPRHENISLLYYFFGHKYEKVKRARREVRCSVLKLVLASSLFLLLGYVVSDGQPRAYIESVIEGSART